MTYKTITDKIGADTQYYWADTKADAVEELRSDVAALAERFMMFEGMVDEVDETWLEEVSE